jgi:hypothetical protein
MRDPHRVPNPPPDPDPDAAFIRANIHPSEDAARLLARVLALKRLLATIQHKA